MPRAQRGGSRLCRRVGSRERCPALRRRARFPAIAFGSLTKIVAPRARSAASCAGIVYGHATTRSGASATMRSRSSAFASPTRGNARASRGQSLCATTPTTSRTGAGGEQQFRRVRREAHDPLRRPRQRHDIAGVVGRRDGRMRRRMRRSSQGQRRERCASRLPSRRAQEDRARALSWLPADRRIHRRPARRIVRGELVVLVEHVVAAQQQRRSLSRTATRQ